MIEVDDLSFAYPGGDKPAVTGLTFAVAPGEVFGFLGPSGAGKSTTQKVLIRLLGGYRGKARVLGRDLDAWSSDYYERIGVSFELPNHYLRLTAAENLAYFASLYSGAARDPRELLDLAGLGEDADVAVGQFSKGMKGRLTVARALLHDPELLFLDEPTAGLDPVNARLVKDLIVDERRRGKTVFLTTHNMTDADELCDRVAFIADGEIRAVDAPRALRLRHGRSVVRVEYGTDEGVAREEFALEPLGEDARFLELVRGGRIQTIHTQEATLEDVFVAVTGRRLS